jgi:hypothetical protein
MQRHLIAVAAALSLFSPALALADTKTLEVTDFTGLDVASGIHAEAVTGSTFSVIADSPNASDLQDLRYSVSGGVFHASYDWDIFEIFQPFRRNITLHITLPRLDRIDISSGANLVATSPVGDALSIDASSGAQATVTAASASTYSIDASSGAAVTIDGTCQSLATDISSGASVDARKLACADATANVSSGGHASVTASSSITANASSGGGIDVFGHPSVKTLDSNSGGRVSFAGD